MFWLIAALASFGLGGVSIFTAMNRLGGDAERAFRKAAVLPASAFAEGAYGRMAGTATSPAPLPVVPGLGAPCLLYELVVYQNTSGRHDGMAWRLVHSERVGVELDVAVDDVIVRVSGQDVQLYTAPKHDTETNLGPRMGYGSYRSHVRYIPPGSTVQVVGTLMLEVDPDPTAERDYRSVATRYRLISRRRQPIVIAAA